MAIGDGALGTFDACHCDDPTTPGTIWRSYSTVDNSPAYGYGAISVRLAKSTDYGASFIDQYMILPSEDLAGGFSINYEVSSICYVAGDARPWKLAYYEQVNNPAINSDPWQRYDITMAWIGLATATDPATNTWVRTYPKFLAGSLNDNAVGGVPTYSSTALGLSETGVLAAAGGVMYLAYQVVLASPVPTDDFYLTVHLDKYTSAGAVRTFCGQFFSYNDIQMMKWYLQRAFPRLADMVDLTAPNLVTQGNITILYVSPASAANVYLGMMAFKVLDLDTCTLNRTKFGMPIMEWFFTEGTFWCGASGYSPYSVNCGVIMDRYSTLQTPNFQLVNTLIRIS